MLSMATCLSLIIARKTRDLQPSTSVCLLKSLIFANDLVRTRQIPSLMTLQL